MNIFTVVALTVASTVTGQMSYSSMSNNGGGYYSAQSSSGPGYQSASSSSSNYATGPSQVFVAWIGGSIINHSSGGSVSTHVGPGGLTVTSSQFGTITIPTGADAVITSENGMLVEREPTPEDLAFIQQKQQQFQDSWNSFPKMMPMAPMAPMAPMRPMGQMQWGRR